MNDELQRILDSTPDPVSRSRLEPYQELILRWRRKGHSYRAIRRLLSDRCGVEISRTPLQEFVQRRSRPRKESQAEPVVMTEYPPALPSPEPEPSQTAAPIAPRLQRSPEELAAQREAIRAAYNKPVVPQEAPKKLFVYDPDKPPINKNY